MQKKLGLVKFEKKIFFDITDFANDVTFILHQYFDGQNTFLEEWF